MAPKDPGSGWSPNQLEKQRQIVEAARLVLARDGLAACTARAVADAGPLTKSAIHYYFADMDELVDQAMSGHIGASVDRVRRAAQRRNDPVDRCWSAVEAYLEMFREAPGAALLWFDYWLDSVRRNRLEPMERMQQEIVGIFAELLAATGVDDPYERAQVLFRFLLGALVDQTVTPQPLAEIAAQAAGACGLTRRTATASQV